MQRSDGPQTTLGTNAEPYRADGLLTYARMATSTSNVRINSDAQGRRVLTHPEAGITRAELVARAKALAPVLKQRARATEDLRHIPPETVEDLTNAGFFRIMSPRRFGGFELGIDVLEEVVL